MSNSEGRMKTLEEVEDRLNQARQECGWAGISLNPVLSMIECLVNEIKELKNGGEAIHKPPQED